MKGKDRATILPQGSYPNTSMEDTLSYIRGVNRTIGFVDDYVTVKGTVEQVVLKKCKIKQFRDRTVEEFQDAFCEGVAEANGTYFLISKN